MKRGSKSSTWKVVKTSSMRPSRHHCGLLSAISHEGSSWSTALPRCSNGKVISAGWANGYGNLVQIQHSGGLTTGYAHLSKISAAVGRGAAVKQGQVIGLVGMTGLATGPHLHYMMARGGKPINPLSMK